MATADYLRSGDSIAHTPVADVAAGSVIVQGELIGISRRNLVANQPGQLHIAGAFRVPKATGGGTAAVVGSDIWWDAAQQIAVASVGPNGNKYFGKCAEAASDADATLKVVIGQSAGGVGGSQITGFVQGSVIFAGATGLAEDNANIFYDDANNRLGLGLTNPSEQLEITDSARIGRDMRVLGNLIVDGTRTIIESETVNVADNHFFMNSGYTVQSPQTGGVVVNYSPTGVVDSVSAGTFVAGVPSTSNPTVTTVGASVYSAEDIIQISGSVENDGLYEVESHAANVLTIRGIGTSGTTFDFFQNDFTANASDNATITKIGISIARAGTDGKWETASAFDSLSISFDKLANRAETLTAGSLLFSDSSGRIDQDNANIFWNDSTKQLSIGTSAADASSLVDLTSTTKGFLGPRMTSTERDAISSPAAGLEIYNSTTNRANIFTGSQWKQAVITPASTLTVGSVPFVIADGEIDDDNDNFFWDNTAKRAGLGTNTPDEIVHIAKLVDGVAVGLLIENSQANTGGSTNETAEIRFGFGGNNDAARISVTKKSDYTSTANEDSALRLWVDINGTATQIVSILNSGFLLGVPASKLDFNGDAGGGGQAIRYKDAGGSLRSALAFPGSDLVALSNQAANGTVEIRANTTTAGSGGEKTIAIFEDDKIQTLMGASTGRSTVGGVADSQFTDVGNVGLGEDTLQTFTLPANALNADGKAIRIRAIFRCAQNNNLKTVKLHFGGTVIGQSGVASLNNRTITFDAIVVRTGASAQRSTTSRVEGVDGLLADNTLILRKTPAENTAGAIAIKGTGETDTAANDDVIQESMLVEFLN